MHTQHHILPLDNSTRRTDNYVILDLLFDNYLDIYNNYIPISKLLVHKLNFKKSAHRLIKTSGAIQLQDLLFGYYSI